MLQRLKRLARVRTGPAPEAATPSPGLNDAMRAWREGSDATGQAQATKADEEVALIAERAEHGHEGLPSTEHRFVAQAYLDLLHRPPDAPSLESWACYLRDGFTKADFLKALRASEEYQTKHPPEVHESANFVLPDVWARPVFQRLVVSRLPAAVRHVVLLGTADQIRCLRKALKRAGKKADGVEWGWDGGVDLDAYPAGSAILVCEVPVDEAQWWAVHRLKQRYGARVRGIQELVIPFAIIDKARQVLPYNDPDIDGIFPHYLGERYFGPIDALDRVFPLAGKSIIEFGPLDGSQTAGLVRAGARRVACVESRPENLIKTLLAGHVFGWKGVELIADDFHNTDGATYGTFDLAFAHGVYYHSLVPLLFLENLLSLSDNVFLGGFCASDDRPAYDYQVLEHQGERYRAKPYQEATRMFTAGVNDVAYYFHGDDLMDFFRRRGCVVTVLSDIVTAPDQPAGRYLHFLARRRR
jgi:hypothetical protein